MNLYVQVDDRANVYEVVGFVGGGWQHWAIVRVGDRLQAFSLNRLRLKTEGEYQHAQTLREMAEEGY